MSKIAFSWRPIEPPPNPKALAVEEIRSFAKLWDRQRKRLKDGSALRRFEERMARWWSIETGIIERIYDISAGTTLVLVEKGFIASLIPHGESDVPAEQLVAILNDHREALDMVMDLVGGTRSLTVGWIKELHALMTRHQSTTTAKTPTGAFIQVPLLHGTFKRQPNNPERPDGGVHEYCPPEQVESEMDRLVSIYNQLPSDVPEVRAAWLHHAFTQIHPFQDGNGRVARALASFDLVKSGLFPLLVERHDRDRFYLPALEAADAGDLGPLVRFFGRCEERILTKAISEAEVAVEELTSLSSVLQAARSKIAQRGQLELSARKVMSERVAKLSQLAYEELKKVAAQTARDIPSVTAKTARSDDKTEGYFRQQIVELAKRNGYWADLRERRAWARLQLRDGGITDVVVSLHLVGNPSPGVGAAVMFLNHRDSWEKELPADAPVSLAVEPLVLTPEEPESDQRHRFLQWLEAAKVQALAQWTLYL